MFKARLIDDPAYYRLRKNLLLIGFPGAIVAAMIFARFQWPVWALALAIITAGLILVRTIRSSRKYASLVRNRSLELTPDVAIVRSGHGKVLETIHLETVDRLEIRNSYEVPGASLPSLVNEFIGKPRPNDLVLVSPRGEHRFDFILDSDYMTGQLNQVIAAWRDAGRPVTVVD